MPNTKYTGTLPTLPARGYFTLKDKGAGVKKIQLFLNWCIYTTFKGDGVYGKNTKKAVKKFQSIYGLSQDGLWGEQTSKKAQSIIDKYTTTFIGELPSLTKTNAHILIDEAKLLSWGVGTLRKKYVVSLGGRPVKKFTQVLNQVFPKRNWSYKAKIGASCDVSVAVCVRGSGIDKLYPRGWDEQVKYIKGNKNFDTKSTITAGCIVQYGKKNASKCHTLIYLGDGIIAEGGYNTGRCMCRYKRSISKIEKTMKKYAVHNIIKPSGSRQVALQYGDNGVNIQRLQNFLNWSLKTTLVLDGDYGDNTQNAVVEFQNKYGLTVDGIFGTECLTKAKTLI